MSRNKKDISINIAAYRMHKAKEVDRLNKKADKRALAAALRDLERAGYKGRTDLRSLIDAAQDKVADRFFDLTYRHYRLEPWVATASMKITSGYTPEEAVARLIIQLPRKKQ